MILRVEFLDCFLSCKPLTLYGTCVLPNPGHGKGRLSLPVKGMLAAFTLRVLEGGQDMTINRNAFAEERRKAGVYLVRWFRLTVMRLCIMLL